MTSYSWVDKDGVRHLIQLYSLCRYEGERENDQARFSKRIFLSQRIKSKQNSRCKVLYVQINRCHAFPKDECPSKTHTGVIQKNQAECCQCH